MEGETGGQYNTWPDRGKAVLLQQEAELVCRGRGSSSSTALARPAPPSPSLPTKPMSLAAALQTLNISYSPGSKCLQAPVAPPTPDAVLDESEAAGTSYYKPGHRKAYSLPRTLEGVDEAGRVTVTAVEHDVVVESPRSTLQRCGLPYRPLALDRQLQLSESSTDLSGLTEAAGLETDSGLGSSTTSKTGGASSRRVPGSGLSSLLCRGLAVARQAARRARGEDSAVAPAAEPAGLQTRLIMEGRPEGLPAKPAREEERHRAEHRNMLDRLRRRERGEQRESAARAAQQRQAEEDVSSLAAHWQQVILPSWTRLHHTKRVQQLWWRGLPPSIRGHVWRAATPNTLNLTPTLYSILAGRARAALQAGVASEGEETLQLIRLDLSRTFPQLGIFQVRFALLCCQWAVRGKTGWQLLLTRNF